MKGKQLKKNERTIPACSKSPPNRPMPTDPQDLARAMFSQADMKMFGKAKAPWLKGPVLDKRPTRK